MPDEMESGDLGSSGEEEDEDTEGAGGSQQMDGDSEQMGSDMSGKEG
jgi:hypothetical protein